MNIETINGGKKSEKKFLPESYAYREQKTMEKNRMEKVQKHVFYKHTNILTKKWGGGKTRENFFPETQYIASFKRWKKIVWKKCENTFFINT